MTENEMEEALRLARNVIKTNTGCPTAALQLARALISCREPVKIQLGSVDHACVCGQRYLSIAYMNFCPGCGRPLVWK